MKKTVLLLVFLLYAAVFSNICAQTDEIIVLAETEESAAGGHIVWNKDGTALILVTPGAVECISLSEHGFRQTITAPDADFSFISAAPDQIIAALSADRQTAALFRTDAPQDVIKIETDFPILSMSFSPDGKWLTADSGDEIRTYIYDTEDGRLAYDVSGFQTAAPVYDTALSAGGGSVLWHARGTFSLQSLEDGSMGETISLWDFASAYALSPDSSLLAVSIINEDYENGTVIFFDPKTGEERGRTDLGRSAPYSLSFSSDGKAFIAADAGTLYRIDPGTFEITVKQDMTDPQDEADRIITAAISPDGNTAALLKSTGSIILAEILE